MSHQTSGERVAQQFRHAADDAAQIAHPQRPGTECPRDNASYRPMSPTAAIITLDDLRHEFGDRWKIARITGGYRAVPRDSGGHTPIPRYGRTPAELAESIRMMEPRP
jgi:hypothetical protein